MYDLDLVPEVSGILQDRMLTEERDVLYVLEMYKFKTRDNIIRILEKHYADTVNENYFSDDEKPIVQSVDSICRDRNFSSLEHECGVLLDVASEDTVNVICVYGESYNKAKVELGVPYKFLNTIYVTPYNYALLESGGKPPSYDADLLLKRIILECVNRKGTDLHLTVHHVNKKPVYKVRYRRNGMLCDMDLFEIDRRLNKEIISILISRNTNKDSIDLLLSDGLTALAPDIFRDKSVELRVSANRVRDGYECVARIQRTDNVTMKIEQLGFPASVQDDLRCLARKQSGITLITGPIRTGKNTTAFAIANEMAGRPIKIKSFESPIEALMDFPQVDYADDPAKLREAIKLAKKQDVNVAFLNEIPNKEVAFAVKDLVNSSVHVITTMHINRIWHLPYKLYEFYGESYKDVICQINGVINQKMFGVLCPHCQDIVLASDLPDSRKSALLMRYGVNTVAVARGCSFCLDAETHTHGIVVGSNQPYTERLIFTEDVRSMLMSCKEPYEMENVIKNQVMQNHHELEQALANGIRDGKLSTDALDSVL